LASDLLAVAKDLNLTAKVIQTEVLRAAFQKRFLFGSLHHPADAA
jgi:hypothetical protein